MPEDGLPACSHKLCQKIFSSLRRLSSSFQNGFKVMDKQRGESKKQEVMGEGIGELEIKELVPE